MNLNEKLSSQNDNKIVIVEKGRITLLDMSMVIHLFCEGYLTTIHMIDNSSITSSKLLKEYENELNPHGFIRINKCIIINIRYLKSVCNKEKIIILTNGDKYKVSQKKYYFLRKFLLETNKHEEEDVSATNTSLSS